tara:strand:+ start:101 stop:448 length:348 start_codon:yes stop_codon:yes gene_type:complete
VKQIPASAVYRQTVEATANHRLGVLGSGASVAELETKIGEGQLEELIEEAKDELELIPKMAEWKPWVIPEDAPPLEIVWEEDAAELDAAAAAKAEAEAEAAAKAEAEAEAKKANA